MGPAQVTIESVASIISQAIGEPDAGSFVVPRTIPGGPDIPIREEGNGQHNVDVAQLGPPLQREGNTKNCELYL